MSPTHKAWLQIHFCVLLWGFTAILGKLITLSALALVWWRMTLVMLALILLPRLWRELHNMSARLRAIYLGIGVLVAAHWLTFYGAIKLANASVAATCMALAPVFIAVIEPRFTGRPFDRRELLLGLAVIPGVALVVGGTPTGFRAGILAGVVSVVFVALFASLNKRFAAQGSALAVTFLEMSAGVVLLTVLAPVLMSWYQVLVWPDSRDLWLLSLLAFGCTLLPFALSLIALRHLTAYGATLAVNLEPVYAILLAIVLLDEQQELQPQFYCGVVIILAAVFAYPLLQKRSLKPLRVDVLSTAESKNAAE